MIFESRSFFYVVCLIDYSVAVINLPINTINTAGIAIPISGTNIEGKRFAKSDDITN